MPVPDQLFAERYEIDQEVGAGGMARVYRAMDMKYERPVAIKILRPELSGGIGRTRFLREISIAARLSHPHILPLFDSGETDGLLFFVMPFVDGPTLRTSLHIDGKLPVSTAVELARDVASALAYAHSQGIVHRDIKPENIMTHNGVPTVADFGIGKALSNVGGEHVTQAGVMVGTPAYMSPEQIAGEPDIDGRSDIYSLGCVLFELLTGQQPFATSTPSEAMAARFAAPPPRLIDIDATLPQNVSDAVEKALARDKTDRFDSATSFAEALTIRHTPARVTDGYRGTDNAVGPSVAVLPFANLSSEPDAEYFSDGITDEIINALMQLKHLHVAARTSSFAFKGKDTAVRDVAERLNVSSILEGSVRQAGSRVRITAQLISAADGYNIWSERYDRELDDVFAIQDEIASTIAQRLNVALTDSSEAEAVTRPTDDIDAYQEYLRGRYLWNRRTEEGLKSSIECFDRAIARDPSFALAYAGKADSYLLLGSYEMIPREESYALATAEAQRALALDDKLAEAHTALGQALRGNLDWAGEERAYLRAIELNPNYATAHQWYGGLLSILGRYDEAFRELQKAQELDPLSHAISNTQCTVLIQARRFEEALEQLHRTLELEPNFYSARALAAYIYARLGRKEEALQEFERLPKLRPEDGDLVLYRAWLHAEFDEFENARNLLEQAREGADPGMVGLVYAALGDKDEAFEYLNRAFDEKQYWALMGLKGQPVFDPMRDDPR